ncbi:hypothetical protein B0H17DRAFT_1261500 [Mycena rosella]|uniref:Uncharacterized protein n=1 Tax=Mycena rosella TaxID=1033263 RepID=A0AAD7G1U6_MYCRO|nr:hypothetical protein B0H17DRAFT_1261500 [Mycena rosella]
MKVRWNTTLAEIKQAQLLQPAFDVFVSGLPNGLTEKPKRVAQSRKKKWEMYVNFFFPIRNVLDICQVLKQCTLEFSKKTAPTITKVLPLYKLMEVTLPELGTEHEFDEPALSTALLAGAAVATKYIFNALLGDYVLLGAVLHPAACIAFFRQVNGTPALPPARASCFWTS